MRRNINSFLVTPKSTMRETIEVIDKGGVGIALVVDNNKYIQGTVTDGDIRRAILKGMSFEEPIENVMNRNFTFVNENASKRFIERLFEIKGVKQIPILNDEGQVVDIILIGDILQKPHKENWAVIMAGGMGTRLRPLTSDIPKPMLKVGNKPILEIIIDQLRSFGFTNILISLNYKGHIIESYFRDGKDFDVNIEYIREKKRLGTAGALSLASRYLNKSFLVINGDILTKLDFEQFMDFHVQSKSDITIATRKHEVNIPYGVVKLDNTDVVNLEEKPKLNFFVNAGIYCVNPSLIDHIPNDEYFDITSLIDMAMKREYLVKSFPIREYWMDIGQIQDYQTANDEYYGIFRSEISATRE